MPSRSWLLGSVTLLLVAAAGCRGTPPKDAAMAVRRVNDNLSRIDQPVQYKGWVSFKFRDAEGKPHRFAPHDYSLIFNAPQSLRFDVRSTLAGDVAQFGSNAADYWLWVDVPETRKLWLGSWSAAGTARRLAIPPNELIDALLLRPLPPALPGGPPPELQRRGLGECWLVYRRSAPGHRAAATREVRVDPFEPYQPREIIDRLADGRVAMKARLDQWRPLGPGGPLTARRYVVDWPLDDAELRLDVHEARFRPDLDPSIFESPLDWRGEIELLDDPGGTSAQPATEAPAPS